MADVAGRLEAIFADLMPGEPVPVARRTRFNCVGWDSLFHLNLIVAIEQEFHVRLTDDDVVDLASFEGAVKIIEERQALRRG